MGGRTRRGLSELLGRVLGPEAREGGEIWWKPGGGKVVGWSGAGDPNVSQTFSVSAVGDEGGEAARSGQDGSRGGEECVGGPSLDPVPEAVHALAAAGVGGEEVGHIGEYGEGKALGDAMA